MKDSNGSRYKADIHATISHTSAINAEDKVLSDINPAVTIKSATVFEVNRDFLKANNWTIEFQADDEINVPLVLSGSDYTTSEEYKNASPNIRNQLQRIEENPDALWEALGEIDRELKQQEALDKIYRN